MAIRLASKQKSSLKVTNVGEREGIKKWNKKWEERTAGRVSQI